MVLRRRLPNHEFRTWFEPTTLHEETGERLVVAVPNSRFSKWIPQKYERLVRAALDHVGRGGVALEFVVRQPSGQPPLHPHPNFLPDHAGEEPAGYFPGESGDRFTFDGFVQGECNRCAFEAALAACEASEENGARERGPLLICGGPGLGKTHLLRAIAHRLLERQPKTRILHTRGSEFTSDVVNAIRSDRLRQFRSRAHASDALLMDDFELIARPEPFSRTVEEFFHVFNALSDRESRIVLTMGSRPADLTNLDPRIRSRLQGGLVVDLNPLDRGTRIAFLARKAEAEGIALPDDVAEGIADRVHPDARALEGALRRVAAYARSHRMRMTLYLVEEVLGSGFHHRPEITIDRVLAATVGEFGVARERLVGSRRQKETTLARHVAFYLCREFTKSTLKEIGEAFGKDRSAVRYGADRIRRLRSRDSGLERSIERLIRRLG